MFRNQKDKTKAYDNKIIELHTQVELEASNLSRILSDRDVVSSDLKNKIEEREKINKEISELNSLINKKKSVCDEFEKYRISIIEEGNNVISILEEKKKKIEFDILFIENKLSDLKDVENKFNELKSKINSFNFEISILESKKIKVKKEIEEEKDSISKDREILYKEKIEVEELIAKKGNILTNIELSKSTVLLYAKRLQKLYNENRVNFDVLKAINLKEDVI